MMLAACRSWMSLLILYSIDQRGTVWFEFAMPIATKHHDGLFVDQMASLWCLHATKGRHLMRKEPGRVPGVTIGAILVEVQELYSKAAWAGSEH